MLENIEKILNLKKINYKTLGKVLNPFKDTFKGESVINVIIDIPSTIKQLYNPENIKGLTGKIKVKDKVIIASGLLNMIGHFRHFFASRWNCWTNIYFVNNSKIDEYIQRNLNINYNKTYNEKRLYVDNPVFGDLNSLMRDTFKIMKLMISRIPHCYFFDTLDMDYRSGVQYIIDEFTEDDELNIILSNNKDLYQSVLFKNTIILQPKGEKTDVITYKNVIKKIAGKSKTIESHPEYLLMNPENILIIDAIINHLDHDIEGIRNYSYLKAIQFINKNKIDLDVIVSSKETMEEFLQEFLMKDEIERVIKNFCIFNNRWLKNKYEEKFKILIDKDDIFNDNKIQDLKEFRKTNDVYFEKYPLLTNYMWEGEAVERD